MRLKGWRGGNIKRKSVQDKGKKEGKNICMRDNKAEDKQRRKVFKMEKENEREKWYVIERERIKAFKLKEKWKEKKIDVWETVNKTNGKEERHLR